MADLTKIVFQNGAEGNTPISNTNLNQMQANTETFGKAIEKEIGENITKEQKRIAALEQENAEQQNKINAIMQDYETKEIQGSSIHINDSLEYDMPISINGGIEQDSREGYNILDYSEIGTVTKGGITLKYTKDGYLVANGTQTSNWLMFFSKNITNRLEDGETYTIWAEDLSQNLYDTSFYLQVTATKADGTNTNYYLRNSLLQFTVDKTTYVQYMVHIQMANYSLTLNNTKNRFMIYEGTDNKVWEQFGAMPSLDFPSEVKGVSGHYDTVVENKNRFNINTCIRDKSLSQTDGKTLSNAQYIVVSDYIGVIPNNSYPISNKNTNLAVRLFYYDKYKNYISNEVINVTGKIAIVSIVDNAYYVRVQGNTTFLDNEFQFEEGTVATDYIEHQEQLLPIDIPTGQVWYSGKPYKENGKWYRNVDRTQDFVKNICDINEWQLNTTNGNIFYSPRTIKKAVSSKQDSDIYCTHFKHKAKYAWMVCPNNYVTQEENKTAIFFRCDSIATLEEWKEFISNEDNNVKINIITETVKEEITDTTLIAQLEELEKAQSYDGVTNVNSYGNEDAAPLVLSGEYVRSNKHRIENIEKALLSLSADV